MTDTGFEAVSTPPFRSAVGAFFFLFSLDCSHSLSDSDRQEEEAAASERRQEEEAAAVAIPIQFCFLGFPTLKGTTMGHTVAIEMHNGLKRACQSNLRSEDLTEKPPQCGGLTAKPPHGVDLIVQPPHGVEFIVQPAAPRTVYCPTLHISSRTGSEEIGNVPKKN